MKTFLCTTERCGDEGRLCDACALKREYRWAAYFGLTPEMTGEQRVEQLRQFRPASAIEEEADNG